MTLAISRAAAETILQLANAARPDPDAAGRLFEAMLLVWESLDTELVHPTSTEITANAD
jgi:hypothetical protein